MQFSMAFRERRDWGGPSTAIRPLHLFPGELRRRHFIGLQGPAVALPPVAFSLAVVLIPTVRLLLVA